MIILTEVFQVAVPLAVGWSDLSPSTETSAATVKKVGWMGFSIILQNRINYFLKKLARKEIIPLFFKTSGRVMVLAQATQRLADKYGWGSKEAALGIVATTASATFLLYEAKRDVLQLSASILIGLAMGKTWSWGVSNL